MQTQDDLKTAKVEFENKITEPVSLDAKEKEQITINLKGKKITKKYDYNKSRNEFTKKL